MKNITFCGVLFGVAAIGLTMSADAANKSKATPALVDAVQGLLQNEPLTPTSSVDRRDVLKPGTRPETDPDTVWWQAGYTLSGKQWRTIEESTASGADAA